MTPKGTEPIKPALTAEEWEGILADPFWWAYRPPQHGGHSTPVITERHGTAAAALYDQPFGFSREDVKLLFAAAALFPRYGSDGIGQNELFARILDLIARIEALLPPSVPDKEGA